MALYSVILSVTKGGAKNLLYLFKTGSAQSAAQPKTRLRLTALVQRGWSFMDMANHDGIVFELDPVVVTAL